MSNNTSGSGKWDNYKYLYGQTGGTVSQATSQVYMYPNITPTPPMTAEQLDAYRKTYTQWLEDIRAALKVSPLELPDDFTAWVEEVRKQDRIEELVRCLYDKIIANKE